MLGSPPGRQGGIGLARAGTSEPRMWRSSGRGWTVNPSAPASCAMPANFSTSGTPVCRELRRSATLLRLTLSRAISAVYVLSLPVTKLLTGFPAKAGIHFSAAREADQWVPAFAGTAGEE